MFMTALVKFVSSFIKRKTGRRMAAVHDEKCAAL
jgi:hypothetical protein